MAASVVDSSVAESVAHLIALNPNGIKTHLGNGLNTFFIKTYQVLVMVLKFYIKALLIALF